MYYSVSSYMTGHKSSQRSPSAVLLQVRQLASQQKQLHENLLRVKAAAQQAANAAGLFAAAAQATEDAETAARERQRADKHLQERKSTLTAAQAALRDAQLAAASTSGMHPCLLHFVYVNCCCSSSARMQACGLLTCTA